MAPSSGGDAHGEHPPQLQSPPRSATLAPTLNLPAPDLNAQGEDLQAHTALATKQPAREEIEAPPPASVLHQPSSSEAIPDPALNFPATCAHPAFSETAAGVSSSLPTQDPAPVAVHPQLSTPTANVASSPTPRFASPALSPAAPPFYPVSVGRSKELRWSDDGADDEEQVDYDFSPSPSPRPATYCDVVRLGSPASSPHPPPPMTAPAFVATVPMGGGGTAVSSVQRRRRRPSHRVRNRCVPPLHAVPPAKVAGGRPPVRERLGPRVRPSSSRRRPRVDADGFVEVISRSNRRRMQRAAAAPSGRSSASSPRRPLPPELRGRCLNCLSYNHRVATCRLPRRCLRCHGLRHLARECWRPRHPIARTTTRNCSLTCSPPTRQDRCRCAPPQPRDASRAGMGAGRGGGRHDERPGHHASPPPRPEHCCAQLADSSIWLVRQREPPHQSMPDPMLIELQAATDPKWKMTEGRSEKAAQATAVTDNIVPSHEPLPEELTWLSQTVQDVPGLGEPELAGPPIAKGSSESAVGLTESNRTSVPQEAPDQVAALGSFLNSIRVKVRPPLLQSLSMNHDMQDDDHGERMPASDAGQDADIHEAVVKVVSPVRLPKRSERIANQKLSCVPAARRGEVILMQKFGMLDQEVPFAGDTRNAYNEVYRGKLDTQTHDAINVLFPARRAARSRPLCGE